MFASRKAPPSDLSNMKKMTSSTSKRKSSSQTGVKTGDQKSKNPRRGPKKIFYLLDEFNEKSLKEKRETLEKGPYCIAENVTPKQFKKKLEELEGIGCFRWMFVGSEDSDSDSGKAYIYELPHRCHEYSAAKIREGILYGLGQYSEEHFYISGSPTCEGQRFGRFNDIMEPDGAVTINGGHPGKDSENRCNDEGDRWPNLIIEVAYTQSLQDVEKKAFRWLRQANDYYGVQQVIIIEIGANPRQDGTRTMRAFRYQRNSANNPVESVDFRDGNGPAELSIPSRSLFHPWEVPEGFGEAITIDLLLVRKAIVDAFKVKDICSPTAQPPAPWLQAANEENN